MFTASSISLQKISVRSLVYRWRQYFSLFLVCAFGVAISFFCNFLVDGMLDALMMKAKIYYGGDFQFVGGEGMMEFFDKNEKFAELKELLPKDAIISPRYDLAGHGSTFYFEGASVIGYTFKGVDFSTSQELFSNFNYVAGGCKDMGGNGVLISEPTAEKLGVTVGDSVVLMFKNNDDITDTVNVVVKGIFRDSSVFGMYTTYFDLEFLRNMMGDPENYCNRFGIFFPNKTITKSSLQKFQSIFEKKYNMFPIVDDKYDFYDPLRDGLLDGATYALISLDANMKDLEIIIEAMRVVTLLVIVALVIIIVVGISSTYRVIVMKRINEIGIYKAIGMSRISVYKLLFFETFTLLIAGCIAGLFVYFGLSALVQCFDFSFIPAFDVFLVTGRAVPLFSLKDASLIFAVILVTTSLAVLFSVKEAVRKMPCEALAVTE